MKKISIATAVLLVIFLILPALVMGHGDEQRAATGSMNNTKHMTQKKEKTKVAEPSGKVQKVQMQRLPKTTKTNRAISAEELSAIRDASILSLFLLIMAIGFSGLVGYSRRHNI